jgi:gamma-glutamyltranspeptidase/glutathione hydrolase
MKHALSRLGRATWGVALCVGLCLQPALAQKKQLLEYPSIHSPVVGEKGMVVSQNATASRVGG